MTVFCSLQLCFNFVLKSTKSHNCLLVGTSVGNIYKISTILNLIDTRIDVSKYFAAI